MLIYIVENNDWEFYNKYGWTTRFERVLDSHEFFPYLTKYVVLYEIKLNDKYKLPKRFNEQDKIISIAGRHRRIINKIEILYDIELPLLRQIKHHLINEGGSTEFIDKEGIELFNDVIENEFPLLGIDIVKKFNQQELNEINENLKIKFMSKINVNEILNEFDNEEPNDNNIFIENSSESSNNELTSYSEHYEELKKIELRPWQEELKEEFFKFIDDSKKTGVIVCPTGSGKSFMIRIFSVLYIIKYRKDVCIMTKRKEIFDHFKRDMKKIIKLMISSGFVKEEDIDFVNSINIIDLVKNKEKHNYKIFTKYDNNSIFLINTDKFIMSTKEHFKHYLNIDVIRNGVKNGDINDFKNVHDYSFGKIELFIHDECHWSGGNKIFQFLKMLKTKINKLIGFSATPSRTNQTNKDNTYDIYGYFKKDENRNIALDKNGKEIMDLRIIYQRSFYDAVVDKDILQIRWIISKMNRNMFEKEEIDDGTGEIFLKLSINGFGKMMVKLNNNIKNTTYKKGILWFKSINDLNEFRQYYIDNYKKYDELKNIQLFRTYSKRPKETDYDPNIETQLDDFKKQDSNAILLAVFRATEGFNDVRVEIGIRTYYTKEGDPLLEIQRMGRIMRPYENKQQPKYLTMELYKNDYRTELVKMIGNWVKFINDSYNNRKYQDNIKPKKEKTTIEKRQEYSKIIRDFIEFEDDYDDNVDEFDFKDIERDILEYCVDIGNKPNEQDRLRKIIMIENERRKQNDIPIIETRNSYSEFAKEHGNMLIDPDDSKDGIKGFDWIYVLNLPNIYYSWNDAQHYMKNYHKKYPKIKSNKIYEKARKKCDRLPPEPSVYYTEFTNMDDMSGIIIKLNFS